MLETEADYHHWLNDAMPGDQAVYYRGYLGEDREKGKDTRVADLVWREYERGAVTLTQRRIGYGKDEGFDYIAECRPRRRTPVLDVMVGKVAA